MRLVSYDEFEMMTVAQLKQVLLSRHFLRTGLKEELIERLIRELTNHGHIRALANVDYGNPWDWRGNPEGPPPKAVPVFKAAPPVNPVVQMKAAPPVLQAMRPMPKADVKRRAAKAKAKKPFAPLEW